MKKIAKQLISGAIVFLCLSQVSAALINRGNGLIYDSVLDSTWLQDANYAQTSGADSDGKMTWSEAMQWASQLQYAGFTEWRLPNTKPINGTAFDYTHKFDGSADVGYNMSAVGTAYAGNIGSEMSYLFYRSLGNAGYYDASGNTTGCQPPDYCFTNKSSFSNVFLGFTGGYWSATEYAPSVGDAWFFSFYDGYQASYAQTSNLLYAWAVHDGDIGKAPAPATLTLLGIGLAGLGVARRRKAQ